MARYIQRVVPGDNQYFGPGVDVYKRQFRHVVQLDKVNQGLTKDLYYLFGEIFPIAVVGVYVPMWFMEGDAVCFETAVGHLGRGRSPEFLNEMKAQILEKGIYNYSKAVLGSNKDFVPNRYTCLLYTSQHLMDILINTLQNIPGIAKTESFISLDQLIEKQVDICTEEQ